MTLRHVHSDLHDTKVLVIKGVVDIAGVDQFAERVPDGLRHGELRVDNGLQRHTPVTGVRVFFAQKAQKRGTQLYATKPVSTTLSTTSRSSVRFRKTVIACTGQG